MNQHLKLCGCGVSNLSPEEEKRIQKEADSLTINAAPLQIPFSIVSYLSNGPTINCRCGVVLATLKCRDLSTAVIDEIESKFEVEVRGDTPSISIFCGG